MSSKVELKAILSQRMESVFPLNKRYDQNNSCLEMRVLPNAYDEHTNPTGIINLGIAWSYICDDIINEKVKTVKLKSAQITPEYYGSFSFRKSLADFYTRKFGPKNPLDVERLIVTNGLTSTLDVLAHIITDPGDIVLTPTPSYAYFSRNFFLRSGVDTWPIDLIDKNENKNIEKKFELTAQKVEDAIKAAIKQGKVVRAFILSNPSNPFGIVYSEELVTEILEVCAKYQIHAVIDECSHLIIFKEDVKFQSAIAYDHIPDPSRTHVLWSSTKDLSVGGSRISVVYSYSQEVTDCFKILSPFYITSTFSHQVLQVIVNDQHWCDEVYFSSYLHRLHTNYQLLSETLERLGAVVHPAEGGLTMMVSFRKFLHSDTFEAEMDLLDHFLKYGIYLYPGKVIWCSKPGWFRIAFAFPKNIIQLGLERIEDALVSYTSFKPGAELDYVDSKL